MQGLSAHVLANGRVQGQCSRRSVAPHVISLRDIGWALPGPLAPFEQSKQAIEVEGLQAQIASLTAQLKESQRRAQYAESRVHSLEVRIQEARALDLVHQATQAFRQHLTDLPPHIDPSQFYEDESRIIGKGGQATVYSFQNDYAVKVDRLAYKHSYRGMFEPERAADLLPALLPPHENILAPKAWWVGTPPAPTQGLQQHVQAEPKWTLYTLTERYQCNLFDYVKQARSNCSSCTQQCAGGHRCKDEPAFAPLLMDLHSILVVVRDVAAALDHLAKHRVVHCDVKAENILLELEESDASDTEDAAGDWGMADELEPGAAQQRRVSRAVLIDFGLARLLPPGAGQVEARGGTWMYKAPESMTGPPGMAFGGQEQPEQPYVTQGTDVWSLGALICMMCRNGAVPASPGLPWMLPPDQLVKWGDRPNGRGGQEPFYMTWDDVLPPEACSTAHPAGAVDGPERQGSACSGAPCSSLAGIDELWQLSPPAPRSCVLLGMEPREHAPVMSLLRRLAWGCMQQDPEQRLTPAQVQQAASLALSLLEYEEGRV